MAAHTGSCPRIDLPGNPTPTPEKTPADYYQHQQHLSSVVQTPGLLLVFAVAFTWCGLDSDTNSPAQGWELLPGDEEPFTAVRCCKSCCAPARGRERIGVFYLSEQTPHHPVIPEQNTILLAAGKRPAAHLQELKSLPPKTLGVIRTDMM